MATQLMRIGVMSALFFFGVVATATGSNKFGLYGIHMLPRGVDAEDYSRPGWGLGFHIVLPFPEIANIIALTSGFEIINLMSDTKNFNDRLTGLRVEQRTDQSYFRLFAGTQAGGHGNAFFRPHAGINIALVVYEIRTDVVVPDDYGENETRQKLRSKTHAVFGSDITLGVDLNFNNNFALHGGVRYLNSFSLPQQLGEGSVTIHPKYFQFYIGIGAPFKKLKKVNSNRR